MNAQQWNAVIYADDQNNVAHMLACLYLVFVYIEPLIVLKVNEKLDQIVFLAIYGLWKGSIFRSYC